MMRTMKLYEQPKLIVLTFKEDLVTTSGLSSGGESKLFDKAVEDFF